MRRASVSLVLAGALVVAASANARNTRCGIAYPPRAPSPWMSMRHDLKNTGLGTLPGVYRGDRPWSFATGAGLFITPVVDGNGVVYFGSADHSFYALTPQGRLCWRFQTGNIIDAAAALDPAQRTVTIGSGDDYLYHLNTAPAARRREIWRYRATAPPAAGQLVDWWEGDVAYGPDRNLYTGNTGGVVYSFTPQGKLRWTFTAGNSVWTMPAFGPSGVTYWGSVDRNIYTLDVHGHDVWSRPTVGFVISSPAIGSDGTIYIGSFDSKLYALDPQTGLPRWTFGTNDHIYSSPALAHDGNGNTSEIYIASTDGSVYALSPSGKLRWSYDTGEAIRSSPVLGPAPGAEHRNILYVGSSDGSLYALDADTGKRRWSFDTVSGDPVLHDRHQLNSSPALSRTGVYIGSEDGHVWYVPYDYCLHRADVRCNTDPGAPYPANMSRVLPVTAGGTTHASGAEGPVPSSSEITGRLLVRHGGSTVYASMLPGAPSRVSVNPSFAFSAQLSGDGRYVFIVPDSFLSASTTYHVTLSGPWGADGLRVANWTQPGTWTRYGTFSDRFSFRTAPLGGPLPLRVGAKSVTAFELRRLAVPLPAFMPSVNQIGFDSYVLLVAPVLIGPPNASGQGRILLWLTQARLGPGGRYLADPHGSLVFPLAGSYRGSTLMLSVQSATLTFSFGKVPLERFDTDFTLTRSLNNEPGSSLYAQALCTAIPNYGAAAYLTGLCNAEGILAAAGTFITGPYHAPSALLSGGPRPTRGTQRPAAFTGRADAASAPAVNPANQRPPGVSVRSVVLRQPTPATAGTVTAQLALAAGARYPAADHRLGILLVAGSGQPLGIDYTNQTTTTDAHGNILRVRLSIPAGTPMPNHLRAFVMADVFPLTERTLY
jgi:outer membrane protein assembly factor BamB